jgi:hypothetical protein
MKKPVKLVKILAFLLVMCIAAALFFACGSDETPNDNANSAETNEGDNDGGGQTEPEPEEEMIPFPHEARDFGGRTLTFLIDRQWDGNSLDVVDYSIEELTGDVLNDAYYNRNAIIEEMFNVKLEGFSVEDISSRAPRTVQSGIDEYVAFLPRLMHAGTFASRGLGVHAFDTNLTLDAPWWDQNILDDTSIGGAAYFFAGDIFIKHYDGIALLMFNKRLLADLSLESPYELVNNNQWTIDNFNSMVKKGTMDLDGDNVMTRHDQFGFVTQLDSVTSWVNASGARIVSKDKDDMPVFTGNSERIGSLVDKMLEIYTDDTYCMHRDAYDRDGGGGQLVQFWIFPEGRGLFYWAFPRYMDLGLRDMEDPFGILPMPKWDSNQDRYYATLNNWHSYTYMIPRTVEDVDSVSILLDAMAYYGRQVIRPAYYDVCLQRKYTRDEESSAMLDIVFASTVYDLGTVYGIGNFIGQLEGDVRNHRNNLAANYERVEPAIDRDIGNLIDAFDTHR